jgi:hypothetical protein
MSLRRFAEAEPPVRVFPGGAWEQEKLLRIWTRRLVRELAPQSADGRSVFLGFSVVPRA